MPPIIDDGDGTDWADITKFPPWVQIGPNTFHNGSGHFTKADKATAPDFLSFHTKGDSE